jgi:hypothetical protein
MTIENFKDLTNRVTAIQSYLKIDEKRMHLKEAELKTQDPSFWNDPKFIPLRELNNTGAWDTGCNNCKSLGAPRVCASSAIKVILSNSREKRSAKIFWNLLPLNVE